MAKSQGKPSGPHVRLLGHGFNLRLRLGDGAAKIADETSGWTTVDRPDNVAMTQWIGGQPLKCSVPIYLDGYHRGESIAHKLNQLHKLVREDDGDVRPKTFVALGPIPFSGHRFTLESIEYGDDIIRGEGGGPDAQKLLRQDLTLNLMQYVPGDDITFHKRKKKKHHGNGNGGGGNGGGGNGHGGGRHEARLGDTTQKIANDVAGPEDDRLALAHAIADLNGIRGTRTKLVAGRALILP